MVGMGGRKRKGGGGDTDRLPLADTALSPVRSGAQSTEVVELGREQGLTTYVLHKT